MSQADPSSEIQVVSDRSVLTTLTLLFFDTLLTLPSEIRHIWCKTFRLGTILYLLARYMPLVSLLVEIYGNLSNISAEVHYVYGSHVKCNAIGHLGGTCTVLSLIGIQGLLLARTYAISLQNQRVLGTLGVLILGAIIIKVHKLISLNIVPLCFGQLQYH
ncbi:hypothetical protein JB92DRAFT_2945893 [Gautieria morchelliformis]|nr:hypothetical protein JB92DRAFT_2945893 [Gautieria morchelliformis]